MNRTKYSASRRHLINGQELESCFAVVIMISIALVAVFFFNAGYLPPPFFFDTDDDFMDWYNTSLYALNSGGYSQWGSIYPPWTFLFLRVFSVHSCYTVFDPVYARSCDWLGTTALFGFFFLNILLTYFVYRKHAERTALPRTIAMALGLPMLFALQRGNLIVPCFTFFILGYGGLLRSAIARYIFIAMTINFKPYLVLPVLTNLFKRRWRKIEYIALYSVIIYVVSVLSYGAGGPLELYRDIVMFGERRELSLFNASYYASSYDSLILLIKSQFPLMSFVGSRLLDSALLILPILKATGSVSIAAVFGISIMKPYAVPWYRLCALAVGGILEGQGAGGYAEVFFLFFIFFENWKGIFVPLALVAAYMLAWPADFMIYEISHEIRNAYISGRTVGYDLGLNIGGFIRPGIVVVIEVALAFATFVDVLGTSKGRRSTLEESGKTLVV